MLLLLLYEALLLRAGLLNVWTCATGQLESSSTAIMGSALTLGTANKPWSFWMKSGLPACSR